MAYGQNRPTGLSYIRNLTGASIPQLGEYSIQSGYGFNIFNGDLVYLKDGFIRNIYDLGGPNVYGIAPALGVFLGCTYTVPTSVSPTDPANPGDQFWPANTNTVGSVPAVARVIDDPNAVYQIQVNVNGLTWESQGKSASVLYTNDQGDPLPNGDLLTGESLMVLNGATVDTNLNRNLWIRRFMPPPLQLNPVPGGGAVQYIDAQVTLLNVQRGPIQP